MFAIQIRPLRFDATKESDLPIDTQVVVFVNVQIRADGDCWLPIARRIDPRLKERSFSGA
ncbi:MAG: hypothetical protein U7126_13620 [Microcoleus sp.]